jgi:lantibiotic modifying enzyme
MDIETLAENRIMDLIRNHGLVEAIECLSTDETYTEVEKQLGELLLNHYKAQEYMIELYIEKNENALEAELKTYEAIMRENARENYLAEMFEGTSEALSKLTIRGNV